MWKFSGAVLGALMISFSSGALEPADPVSFCQRFIGEKEIVRCQERTSRDNVDWYAASLCNLQKEDTAFWKCWDSVKDKAVNPQALQACAADIDASDDERQRCLLKTLNTRAPASASPAAIFQPLKKKSGSN